jgi:hypothetical protein
MSDFDIKPFRFAPYDAKRKGLSLREGGAGTTTKGTRRETDDRGRCVVSCSPPYQPSALVPPAGQPYVTFVHDEVKHLEECCS